MALVRDEGADPRRTGAPGPPGGRGPGLEAATGLAIRFSGDLELVMSSFTGVP